MVDFEADLIDDEGANEPIVPRDGDGGAAVCGDCCDAAEGADATV